MRQALESFHRVGEKGYWEENVLQNLAAVSMSLGEPEAALRSHRQVLERQRALGDRKGEARTLNNLGVLFDSLGQLGEALEAYAAALAIVRPSGDRLWEAALLHNLGVAWYGLGDFQRALANLEQALAICREIGDKPGEARAEIFIGYAWFRLGETPRRSTPAAGLPPWRVRPPIAGARCSRAACWARSVSRPASRRRLFLS